jgi:hypothetical protein
VEPASCTIRKDGVGSRHKRNDDYRRAVCIEEVHARFGGGRLGTCFVKSNAPVVYPIRLGALLVNDRTFGGSGWAWVRRYQRSGVGAYIRVLGPVAARLAIEIASWGRWRYRQTPGAWGRGVRAGGPGGGTTTPLAATFSRQAPLVIPSEGMEEIEIAFIFRYKRDQTYASCRRSGSGAAPRAGGGLDVCPTPTSQATAGIIAR